MVNGIKTNTNWLGEKEPPQPILIYYGTIIPNTRIIWFVIHDKCCPPLCQPSGHFSDSKTFIQRLTYTLMNVGEEVFQQNLIWAWQCPLWHLPNVTFNMVFYDSYVFMWQYKFQIFNHCNVTSSFIMHHRCFPVSTRKLLPQQKNAFLFTVSSGFCSDSFCQVV